jgi:hypothetical protein
MDITVLVDTIVNNVIYAAVELLSELPQAFSAAVDLIYDTGAESFTPLGGVLIATAGFALAYSGIRFVFAFISKLLNSTRGGGR